MPDFECARKSSALSRSWPAFSGTPLRSIPLRSIRLRSISLRAIRAAVILTTAIILLPAGVLAQSRSGYASEAASGSAAGSGSGSAASALAPSEIVRRLVEQNQIRSDRLRYFTSRRHYHVEFHGLGRSMAADMDVQATYTAGSGKTFQVLNESGSRILLNHVLKKLLDTEQADSQRHESSLTSANYTFNYQEAASENGRRLYVFAVEPKQKSELLYRGKIWVDAQDYAVTRVDAQPAENPSFWIKSTEIHHVYAKEGEFWLPQTNRSQSKIRLGGTALLTIDYGTYQFEQPHGTAPAPAAGVASQ